jgi:hypothetical protein
MTLFIALTLFFCSYVTLEPYLCLFSIDFNLKQLDLQALRQLGFFPIVMALKLMPCDLVAKVAK